MVKSILGKKLRQTRRFDSQGKSIPVSEVEAGPCTVMQIKTTQKDGYQAIKLGFGLKKVKKSKEAGKQTPRFLKEVQVEELDRKVGDLVKVGEVFETGDKISVSGTSKGKGFAGVVKRWGFAGGPRTHGQSDRERAPGSIGQTTTPGRVYKGKKMAGRMGQEKVTVKGLEVIEVNPEKNLLVVSGLIPGAKGSLVLVSKL